MFLAILFWTVSPSCFFAIWIWGPNTLKIKCFWWVRKCYEEGNLATTNEHKTTKHDRHYHASKHHTTTPKGFCVNPFCYKIAELAGRDWLMRNILSALIPHLAAPCNAALHILFLFYSIIASIPFSVILVHSSTFYFGLALLVMAL